MLAGTLKIAKADAHYGILNLLVLFFELFFVTLRPKQGLQYEENTYHTTCTPARSPLLHAS
jgi:hypothetical protein